MTAPGVAPWSGELGLAERYAALRHPAVVPVRARTLPDGAVTVTAVTGIEGRPVTGSLPVADALRATGEIALGLQALHDLDLAHGALGPEQLRRTAERWVLEGVAHPGDSADRQADVVALANLLTALVAPPERDDPRVRTVATAAARAQARADDVGRTALALAAGNTVSPDVLPVAPARPTPEAAPAPGDAEAQARQRTTRNRMLLVGVLVVLVGAFALRLLDTKGIVRVPRETGRVEPAAAADLRRDGLVPREVRTVTPAATPGTVVGQSPAPGVRVRPGRTVVLRVATAGGGR